MIGDGNFCHIFVSTIGSHHSSTVICVDGIAYVVSQIIQWLALAADTNISSIRERIMLKCFVIIIYTFVG